MRRSRPFLGLVITLALSSTGGLSAETWTAELGLAGLVVPGTWAPLRVEVDASWGQWSLEVERPTSRTGNRSVEIFQRSAGGRFEVPLLVPEDADSLILRAVVDGQVKAERTLEVSRQGFPGHIVGVWGLPAGAHRALSAVLEPEEPVRVVDLPPRLWPSDALAWQGLSALALPDPGSVLSPAQVRAVRAWIHQGGRLLLIAPRTDASLAQQIRPEQDTSPSMGWGLLMRWNVPATDRELLQTPAWSDRLKLLPFQEQPTLARALSTRTTAEPASNSPISWLLPVAALWSAACGFLVWRRRGPTWWAGGVASLALVALLGAGVAGALPQDRGTVTHVRQAYVPGGEGLEWGSVSSQARAPWGWSTSWGGQSLTMDPVGGTTLVHPVAQTGSTTEISLGLTGALRTGWARWIDSRDREQGSPAGPTQNVPTHRVTFRNGKAAWSALTPTGWTGIEQVPSIFVQDEAWLRRVAMTRPGEVWDMGRHTTVPGSRDVVWIRPATSEAPL